MTKVVPAHNEVGSLNASGSELARWTKGAIRHPSEIVPPKHPG